MSRHHIEKVTCPSCHHEGDFELWDSINTALDPEMKEKVLNKSIFLYTCPSCGETFRLNYPTPANIHAVKNSIHLTASENGEFMEKPEPDE